MAATFKKALFQMKSLSPSRGPHTDGFVKAPEGKLFPQTNPNVDGPDCATDCMDPCVKLPRTWKIDEDTPLYGGVKPWSTHVLVATNATDWVRDVADEKGSIMEAIDQSRVKVENGRMTVSATNMPVDLDALHSEDEKKKVADVLLLPAFQIISNVSPSNIDEFLTDYVNKAPTSMTPLKHAAAEPGSPFLLQPGNPNSALKARTCPHRYLILMCSQKTRDARCGQSAPLLRKEFERHLRPLGLYRDLHDTRPGGVGIYFISHTGGHKFSANVMIYRKAGTPGNEIAGESGDKEADENTEAGQCIWLARVRPEDCENIVRYTVLQGKVVKPERQLRGGFDRCKGLVSW